MSTVTSSVDAGTVVAIIDEFRVKVEPRFAVLGFEPRGAHPRHHGIVRATFEVPAGAHESPPELARLKKGLFGMPGTYRAYVRFSNAGGAATDAENDFRGMAIKVMGVPGEKLLSHELPEDEAFTQDFHLANFPVFFARDPDHLRDFLVARRKIREAEARQDTAALQALGTKLAQDFPQIGNASVIHNPLRVAYFSQSPYELGPELLVKYQARPRVIDATSALSAAEKANPTFLRQAMLDTLKNGEDVVFDFMVQPRTNPDTMPIEDPTKEWQETESPFVPVATITIPGQDFTSPAQMAFAEQISFSPWHGLVAHRPAGALNEARREAYRQMAKHRHDRNGVQYKEPTGQNDF
jgi:catalase